MSSLQDDKCHLAFHHRVTEAQRNQQNCRQGVCALLPFYREWYFSDAGQIVPLQSMRIVDAFVCERLLRALCEWSPRSRRGCSPLLSLLDCFPRHAVSE